MALASMFLHAFSDMSPFSAELKPAVNEQEKKKKGNHYHTRFYIPVSSTAEEGISLSYSTHTVLYSEDSYENAKGKIYPKIIAQALH
ncbi:hypothetical protein HYALB_00007059 [Hymenoscyphus albidus]|uniref:Uncharacterized protein n=1 Tax=Hymenoscyphus albidus TaxID=595503 RepID=A0A9N9Q1C0_9HELO|nr:hypothetical protein HYALB_00007059 [Hymenoscyphus albidus]